MIPPRSPYSLIQEDLWPDEFRILVSCMLLNCTTRRQVEKVVPAFFSKWPDAKSLAAANQQELSDVISSLGFKNRRSENLIKMAKAYLVGKWKSARDLPGIGDYAGDAWDLFCRQKMPQNCPNDHALTLYYKWRKKHE